jgi:hypothetical protein
MAREHGATRLEVLDELINVNERHWDHFLSLVTALKMRFDVPNGMRADYLEAHHFAAMKPLVTTVSVSAESGVQRESDGDETDGDGDHPLQLSARSVPYSEAG